MSVSYYSIAVVGVPITGLYRQTETPSCGHEIVPGKFCPECGLPRTFLTEPVEWFDKDARKIGSFSCRLDAEPLDPETARTPEGLWFVGQVCKGWGEDYPPRFIGLVGNGWGTDRVYPRISFNVDVLRIRLQEVLDPIGKWDETKFGLWSFIQKQSMYRTIRSLPRSMSFVTPALLEEQTREQS